VTVTCTTCPWFQIGVIDGPSCYNPESPYHPRHVDFNESCSCDQHPDRDSEDELNPWTNAVAEALRDRAEKAEQALAAARAENERLKDVGRTLVRRLDFVHASDEYRGVWTIAHVHGAYQGPMYVHELNAARALFCPTPEAPKEA